MAEADKKKVLEEIYDALAADLLERIKSGSADAKDLAVARQFLKDNNISGVALYGSPIAQISEALPFDDASQEGPTQEQA